MPILLIIFLAWLFWPQGKRKRKTTIKYTVSNPVKVQREQIRIEEQQRKAAERERKQAAQKKTSAVKAKQNELLIAEYAKYIQSLQLELNDSNISLSRYNQVTKEILRAQEKITKYGNDANKAFFESLDN